MRAFWLIPRVYALSLFTGWMLSVLCLLLIAKMPGGAAALCLIWLLIGWARWYYSFHNGHENTAFLHNLLLSERRLWLYVACYEAFPWLLALLGLIAFA